MLLFARRSPIGTRPFYIGATAAANAWQRVRLRLMYLSPAHTHTHTHIHMHIHNVFLGHAPNQLIQITQRATHFRFVYVRPHTHTRGPDGQSLVTPTLCGQYARA